MGLTLLIVQDSFVHHFRDVEPGNPEKTVGRHSNLPNHRGYKVITFHILHLFYGFNMQNPRNPFPILNEFLLASLSHKSGIPGQPSTTLVKSIITTLTLMGILDWSPMTASMGLHFSILNVMSGVFLTTSLGYVCPRTRSRTPLPGSLA